jgi:AraC-like DNA-binding protein
MTRIEKPAAALQPFVRYYVHVEGCFEGQAVDQPVPARTGPCIEFTFGDPYEVWSEDRSCHEMAHPVAVIGAQTYRRVHLAMHGHVETFVIVFQPGGLSRLFAVPANVLTNQHFEGRAVLGRSVDELRCRLGESPSFAERVRVVDNSLQLLLARTAPSPPGAVTAAARELLGGRGSFRVAVLAKRAGLSPRQFERRFVSEVGMPPKIFGRIARFEMALHCKMHSPSLRWAEIAHDLGYYDQMHMVRDFRRLSGAAPSDVAPRLDLLVPRSKEIGSALG